MDNILETELTADHTQTEKAIPSRDQADDFIKAKKGKIYLNKQAEADQNFSQAEAEKPDEIIYDRNAVQRINLQIPRGEKLFDVSIELNPLSDADYLELLKEVPAAAKKLKGLSTELFAPFAEVAKKLAVARHGYAPRADWREKTHPNDYVGAMLLYLTVSALPENETAETNELLDDEADVKIPLKSVFSGYDCFTSISFKGWETQEQRDEYIAAKEGQPRKNALASHSKLSKEERLLALYDDLFTVCENYADSDVPAWHRIAAIDAYFAGQLSRMGKSLNL